MSLLEVPSTIEAMPGVGGQWVEQRADDCRDGGTTRACPINPGDAGFVACRKITAARARNFYLGLRLAPEPRRSALLALYAWMREADDLADAAGPGDSAASRGAGLDALEARTLATLQGKGASPMRADSGLHASLQTESTSSGRRNEPCLPSPPHAGEAREEAVGPGATSEAGGTGGWWSGFEAMVRAYPVPVSVFEGTLEALRLDARSDVTPVDVATAQDLAWYTDRVAGTVAIACVSIWGLRGRGGVPAGTDEAARAGRLAVLRARAVQLTNILRDLREDVGMGRSYLPREAYEAHGLSPETLMAWRDPCSCAAFVGSWIDEARRLYAASRELESVIDPTCARVSWGLAAVYRALLETMARDPARVVRERVRVGTGRKMSIAVAGYLGVGLPG